MPFLRYVNFFKKVLGVDVWFNVFYMFKVNA